VQKQAIEIHDSAFDQVELQDGTAVLHFKKVYIHSSDGRPAIDAGTGWVQEAVVRIGNARIDGAFSKESREAYGGYAHYLSGGSLRIDSTVSENLIPIPLDLDGDIELKIACWDDVVCVRGNSIRLELVGAAEYVEEFQPRNNSD
jgi:hypothetical protein